jgi:uncharacterized tellurite resistance protein B-like protein
MTVKHPLMAFAEKERVNYLSLLAAISYSDKDFHENEKKSLMSLCDSLEISDAGRGVVFSAVFSTDAQKRNQLAQAVNDLQNSDLKFTLISELYLMAFSDGVLVTEEEAFISEVADRLKIDRSQVQTIKEVQNNLQKLSGIPTGSAKFKEGLKDAAANLAAAGIPIAAIAASGSVFGLSAAGIVSGLAALGALVGGGMLAGTVLVIPALAIGSYKVARKIIDSIWE